MHAPLATRIACLTPDNAPSSAPFGAFAPNAAQAAIIRLAQQSGLKRGAFRPWLSRLVNLIRGGPIDVQYQGVPVKVPFGSYDDAMVTGEWTPLEPDVLSEKIYVKGVGQVKEFDVTGGDEVFELMSVTTS